MVEFALNTTRLVWGPLAGARPYASWPAGFAEAAGWRLGVESVPAGRVSAVASVDGTFACSMEYNVPALVPGLVPYIRRRLDEMADRACGCGPAGRPGHRLVVQRPSSRQIQDEDGAPFMMDGFANETMEGRGFCEQVCMFRGARQVVVAHGAAATNLAFMPTGGLVVEVFPSGYQPSMFATLARVRGVVTVSVRSMSAPSDTCGLSDAELAALVHDWHPCQSGMTEEFPVRSVLPAACGCVVGRAVPAPKEPGQVFGGFHGSLLETRGGDLRACMRSGPVVASRGLVSCVLALGGGDAGD